MSDKGKTLTINRQNHLELCRLKLEMQDIVKNKVRIDFDMVLEYLLALHKQNKEKLQKYVKLVIA